MLTRPFIRNTHLLGVWRRSRRFRLIIERHG